MIRLATSKDLRRHVERGHPWIYASALRLPASKPPPGAVVEVVDARDAFLARGFFDPDGPIAVRVLTCNAAEPFDAALVTARVRSACAARRLLPPMGDALRLLHGESDRVPGLVLDHYAGLGVARFDGPAAEAAWRPHVPAIVAAVGASGWPIERVWGRASSGRGGGRGEPLHGGPPPAVVEIHEGAARYEVDVVHGQKTGFFLDQRDNRRFVAGLSAGLELLNLFGYTGGFSLAAALAGARHVTTVDLSRPAIEAARRNFERSGVPPAAHAFEAVDVFDFLRDARAAGRRWDVVVCDPPSFAPSEKAKAGALIAYRDLNRSAAEVVAPGGLLATASCSSHVTENELSAAVGEAVASLGRTARVLAVRGAAGDHPVDPAFPEGRYLKFLLVQVG